MYIYCIIFYDYMSYKQDLDFQFSPYSTLSSEEKNEHDVAIKKDNSFFVNF